MQRDELDQQLLSLLQANARESTANLARKLGVARNSVKASTPTGQTPIPISGNHTGLLVGFGAQYDFDNRISLRGELTSFGKPSSKSTGAGLSMGVGYRF